jgi:hypothetical protein
MSKCFPLIVLLAALATPPLAAAAVVNGGFETGTLAGWTPIGFTKTETAAVGVTPTVGTYQGYLNSTGNFTASAPAVLASLTVDPPDILTLGAGTPTVGSGLSQDVTVAAGDTLTFDWNFLTDELDESATFNDFAFFSIAGVPFLLASRNSSTFNIVSPPAGFDGQTGWMTQSYTFTAGGTYKLGFGVFNVGDTGHDSVLLLDAVTLPVPEPTSLALIASGMSIAFFKRRRRRR